MGGRVTNAALLSHNLKADRNGPWSAVRAFARHGEQSRAHARLAGELLVLAADAGGGTRARDPLICAGGTPNTLWRSRAAQESAGTMPGGSSVLLGWNLRLRTNMNPTGYRTGIAAAT